MKLAHVFPIILDKHAEKHRNKGEFLIDKGKNEKLDYLIAYKKTK